MTDDTPTLTIHALTALGHELGFMSAEWADVSLGGEIPAAMLAELRERWESHGRGPLACWNRTPGSVIKQRRRGPPHVEVERTIEVQLDPLGPCRTGAGRPFNVRGDGGVVGAGQYTHDFEHAGGDNRGVHLELDVEARSARQVLAEVQVPFTG